MASTVTDIRFINSVIQWLSEFPSSPISSNSIPSDLAKPVVLYKLFKILFNEEDLKIEHDETNINELFQNDIEIKYTEENLIISLVLEKQTNYLEMFILNHLNNAKKKQVSLNKIKRFETILHQLNFFKLTIFKDLNSITRLMELLVRIGTFSSKLSTFGLTSIQFLSDSDKISINEYFGTNLNELINNDNEFEKDLDEINFQDRIKLLEDEKNLELINESNKFNLEKLSFLKIIDNLKEANESLNNDYNNLLKNMSNDQNSEISFVDEDYINSINWENSLFESLIYDLAMNQIK